MTTTTTHPTTRPLDLYPDELRVDDAVTYAGRPSTVIAEPVRIGGSVRVSVADPDGYRHEWSVSRLSRVKAERPCAPGTVTAVSGTGRRCTIDLFPATLRGWVSVDVDPGSGPTSWADDVTSYRITGGHPDAVRAIRDRAVARVESSPFLVDPTTPGGRSHGAWIDAVEAMVTGVTADGRSTHTADGRPVALDRPETDPCQAGTPGCCVDHRPGDDGGCDTW